MSDLRFIRSSSHTAKSIPCEAPRAEKETKNMGRRRLNDKEMLKGVERALASKKTPPQLRPALSRRAETLRKKLRSGRDGMLKNFLT